MQELRELRRRAGLSVTAVARRMEIERGTVHSWESGRKRPSPELLSAALELYGASDAEVCRVAHHYALGKP